MVLIVEDYEDLRDLYEEILKAAGHDVRAVETAAAAIAALDSKPEVVVIDLGIDGGARPVVEALRSGGGRAKVLVVSGVEDVAKQAEALGAAGWLRKPFSAKKLAEAVAVNLS
jgi:DNA-binding response OmpR family regulator